jgi:hypothetical protein
MKVQHITNLFFTVYELVLNPFIHPLERAYERISDTVDDHHQRQQGFLKD